MARFPSKEAEVFALAQEMMTGLPANAVIYPPPPGHRFGIGNGLRCGMAAFENVGWL